MNLICWLLGHNIDGHDWDDDELGAQSYSICTRCLVENELELESEENIVMRLYYRIRYGW